MACSIQNTQKAKRVYLALMFRGGGYIMGKCYRSYYCALNDFLQLSLDLSLSKRFLTMCYSLNLINATFPPIILLIYPLQQNLHITSFINNAALIRLRRALYIMLYCSVTANNNIKFHPLPTCLWKLFYDS